jgi:putative SOS response-associated peptidase YedK
MCGRFTQTHSAEDIAATFGLAEIPQWPPRYNVAPTQVVPTISALRNPEGTVATSGRDRQLKPDRQFKPLRWGLIPSWAKDLSIGAKLINARAETLQEKPSFRDAFKRRRCLIVADGFYEWKKQAGKKQPFYFRLENGELFAFAGLWDRWHSSEGDVLETCTIITTHANELAAPVHDRMPVILPPEHYDRWLDPNLQTTTDLQTLLRPYPTEAMSAYPVSAVVNSPTHDQPDCVAAI